MSDWMSTHGGEYAVPEEVLDLLKRGVLEDISYGNDACPRFGRRYPQIGPEVWLVGGASVAGAARVGQPKVPGGDRAGRTRHAAVRGLGYGRH